MSNNEQPAVMYNDGTILIFTPNQATCLETPKSKNTQVVRSITILKKIEKGKLSPGGAPIE